MHRNPAIHPLCTKLEQDSREREVGLPVRPCQSYAVPAKDMHLTCAARTTHAGYTGYELLLLLLCCAEA